LRALPAHCRTLGTTVPALLAHGHACRKSAGSPLPRNRLPNAPSLTASPRRLQSPRTLDAGPLEVYLVSMHPGREGVLLGCATTVALPATAADEVVAAAACSADSAGAAGDLGGLMRDLAVAWRLPTPAGAEAGLVSTLLHHFDAVGMRACQAALAARIASATPQCSLPAAAVPRRSGATPVIGAASGSAGEQDAGDVGAGWQADPCAHAGAASARLSVAGALSAAESRRARGEQHARKGAAPGPGGRVSAALATRAGAGGHGNANGERGAVACSASPEALMPGGWEEGGHVIHLAAVSPGILGISIPCSIPPLVRPADSQWQTLWACVISSPEVPLTDCSQ
jgi:hypothetical protein